MVQTSPGIADRRAPDPAVPTTPVTPAEGLPLHTLRLGALDQLALAEGRLGAPEP